jgi:hypothetical protein
MIFRVGTGIFFAPIAQLGVILDSRSTSRLASLLARFSLQSG